MAKLYALRPTTTVYQYGGDSDFIELVRHLKAEGVRVEIAAVKKTTAKILLEEASYFHEITKDDWFEYKAPGKGGKGKKKSSKRIYDIKLL